MSKYISKRMLKFLLFTGITGPLFYFTVLSVLGLMWEEYDPIVTGMSELGAVDSPYRHAMNFLGFSVLGIIIVLFSFGFRAYFKHRVQMTASFLLLLLGGIFMFTVGFLPCDSQCIDVTITGRLHSVSSMLVAIAMPLAAMLSAHPISKLWSKKWAYFSFYLGLVSMAAGPVMFLETFNDFAGLIQRIGIACSLLWMMIISLKINKELQS